MRGPLLGAIALAIGCQKELTIEIGDVDFDYGFAVIYPAEGPPTRVTPPFGVAEGRITFGEPPAILLDREEKRFVFVALHASDLPASFEIARASELGIMLERPPESLLVEGIGLTDLTAKTRLPEQAQLFTTDEGDTDLRPVEEAEFDLRDEITVRIPVEPEHCRIVGQTPQRKFAERAAIGNYGGFESVHYLGPDKALVANRRYVFVVDRGGTVTSSIGNDAIWSVWQDPKRIWADGIFDLAVGPLDPDGTRPLIAVGGDFGHESGYYGRIWPLRLIGDRVVSDGESLVTRFDPIPEQSLRNDLLYAATFSPDGRAWVGGPYGVMLTRAPGETAFSEVTPRFEHRVDFPDIVAGLVPIAAGGYTMMAGLKNHLFLLKDGVWEGQLLMRSGILSFEEIRFGGLAAVDDPDGADLWAVGKKGQIARRKGEGEWLLLAEHERDLVYPPAFLPCAIPTEPGEPLLFNGQILDILAFEDYVHLGLQNCNALVVVRRSDQCVSLVAPEGEPVEFTSGSITTLDRWERRILIGTAVGVLYETVLP